MGLYERAFVFDRTMTAITQYNSKCFVPEVVEEKEQLLESMVRYYEEHIKGLLPYEGYVIGKCSPFSLNHGTMTKI